MTLKDLLGQVVGQLEAQQQDLDGADPDHPTHGTDLLGKFRAAFDAASHDPNADLGMAFQQISGVIGSSGQGFTSKAYGDAFGQGAQLFAGRSNQLSLNDLGPLLGMLTQGFANHDTRGVNAAGPLGALGPLLGMLAGGSGGGGNIGNIIGGLLGGGGNAGGGLGGILGSMLGGQPQQQQNPMGGLGDVLGGLLGGGQPPQQQQGGLGGLLGSLMGGGQPQQPQGGMNDILGQLMGAVRQGSQMTNANGHRDAGASSTGAVLSGLLNAFLK
jgi:hypothetical protein